MHFVCSVLLSTAGAVGVVVLLSLPILDGQCMYNKTSRKRSMSIFQILIKPALAFLYYSMHDWAAEITCTVFAVLDNKTVLSLKLPGPELKKSSLLSSSVNCYITASLKIQIGPFILDPTDSASTYCAK